MRDVTTYIATGWRAWPRPESFRACVAASASLEMTTSLEPAKPRIGKIVARAVGRPARRIDFTVWFYRNGASPGATATLSQITDEFLTSVELRARWLIMIKIAYQTNAERDIVEIIAVHVPAIDLTPPAISDFDLPISGRCAVTNHEMIRKAVLHPAD